ncbi:SDR family oxidoreductase [Rhodohalobacter sp. SW132]|uniref:SDR family oxidoreductase n=1 Tax=Rhodohalobacter sp. SW132 TaxID=2293433 RepID=UPI000E256303|nr:SDR family oxidoreductase [Rhodohalobacter sp. SW132]REL29121.1 SDR family oxidoreductase [Rhodohalobacter sp. SW132]
MDDKVVLIVGGSGGIGQASADLFTKAGAKVVLAARDRSKADDKAKEINDSGGEAFVIEVDVTDLASVSAMAREVHEDLGQIDVLVNAFGVGLIQPVLDIKPDHAKEVFDVNVFGTFLVTQAVMRYMATDKQGRIIMFPGILGKAVMKNTSVYSASKYAVTGFTKALVVEQRRGNIKFSLLYLGGVDTEFWDNPNVDMRVQKDKMLSPQEVAKAVYYAASQPAQSVLNEIVIQPESHQMV